MGIRRVLGKIRRVLYAARHEGEGLPHAARKRHWKNAILPMPRISSQNVRRTRSLKNGCKPGIQKVTRPLYDRVKGKDPVTKMQYVDLHLWLVHDILMKGDKMGMANSLEVRVPFTG